MFFLLLVYKLYLVNDFLTINTAINYNFIECALLESTSNISAASPNQIMLSFCYYTRTGKSFQ